MKNSPRVLALASPNGTHVIFAYQMHTSAPVGWLKVYDPDAYSGRGRADFTDNQSKALRFDKSSAFECWRLVSAIRPVRMDGKPNRPLTAFHVSIHPYGEQPI